MPEIYEVDISVNCFYESIVEKPFIAKRFVSASADTKAGR